MWRIFVAKPPAHEDPQLRRAKIGPVQAKGGSDILGVIQTIQDMTFCQAEKRYKNCIPCAVTAPFLTDDHYSLRDDLRIEVSIVRERHYKLT